MRNTDCWRRSPVWPLFGTELSTGVLKVVVAVVVVAAVVVATGLEVEVEVAGRLSEVRATSSSTISSLILIAGVVV